MLEIRDFRNYSCLDVILLCMLLSPSMTITLVYVIVYFIAVILVTIAWRDLDDANFAENHGLWVLYCTIGLFSFVLLQKRELRNFYMTQDAVNK